MLVCLCDGCRKPLPPEKARPEDMKPGQAVYCDECAAEAARKEQATSSTSCKDCQVAVWNDRLLGAASFDLATNVFCSSCDQNPTRRSSPKKFRCNRCGDIISIDDLRGGKAYAVGEKAFCSTCKRKMPESRPSPVPPPARPATVPVEAAAAPLTPKTPASDDLQIATSATRAVMKSPTRGTGEVRCDMCNKSFKLADLRSGSAQIKDGKVLCPRCLSRLSRRTGKYDAKFVVSLVFIIVVFPLVSAALIVIGFLLVNSSKNPEKEENKNQGSTEKDRPAKSPGSRPGAGSGEQQAPPEDPSKSSKPQPAGVNISPEDMNEIIKNLKEGSEAPPKQPSGPRLKPLPPSAEAGNRAGDPSISVLLDHADPSMRLEGVLRAAASGSDAFAPKLIEKLGDSDPWVRAMSAQALGKLNAQQAGQPLLKLIRDPEKAVRQAAARSLVRVMDIRFKHADDFTAEELDRFIKYLEWLKKKK